MRTSNSNYHYPYYEEEEDESESEFFKVLRQHHIVVVATIFLIAVQGPALRWYRNRMQILSMDSEMTTSRLLFDLGCNVLNTAVEVTRASGQILLETVRRRLPMILFFQTTHPRNRSNSLPELDDCTISNKAYESPEKGPEILSHQAKTTATATSPISEQTVAVVRTVRTELEPAFLKESDYPPNWMVYHPELGVVLKTEADRYDREHASNGLPALRPSVVAT